jgi:hypothetical protein
MAETIEVHVPRAVIADDLTEALGAHGLHAELFDDGDRCALHVSYATTEADRLAAAATHVIELWLADQNLPFVVQQADGGAVVRPPGD